MERFKVCLAVHLLIIKDNKILLQRRNNPNKYAYRKLAMPAGHLEAGENPDEALIREMKEELGIDLKDFELVQVMSLNGDTGVYDSYFYLCKDYDGEIRNMEPENIETVDWYDMSEPLEDLIPYEKYALEKYLDGKQPFTKFGW